MTTRAAAKTIETVVKNGLCCGCGTCEGVCPEAALKMTLDEEQGSFLPELNNERCISCGVCYQSCPGHSVDFKTLNLTIFGQDSQDALMGNYRACYVGHAADYELRYNAASGGVTTALLQFALKENVIDGALVVKMNKERPLEPQPFIARTFDELADAARSKYCPVPMNKGLRDIMHSPDGEKFAVVGLPCQLHGVRKAEQINKKLREKVVLHLGIFCSHTDTFWQTRSLLAQVGAVESDIERIDYRGHGWPGTMSISLKSGQKIELPFSDAVANHLVWINALPRCLFCCDLTAELADVSCGDAWLPEIRRTEGVGKSLVVARTQIGQTLCLNGIREGVLTLEPADADKVKQSGYMMQSKKRDIRVRFLVRKILRRPTPEYTTALLRPSLIGCGRGLFIYVVALASSKRRLRGSISAMWHESRRLLLAFKDTN